MSEDRATYARGLHRGLFDGAVSSAGASLHPLRESVRSVATAARNGALVGAHPITQIEALERDIRDLADRLAQVLDEQRAIPSTPDQRAA